MPLTQSLFQSVENPGNFDLFIYQVFIEILLCARHFQVLLDPESILRALSDSNWVCWDNITTVTSNLDISVP